MFIVNQCILLTIFTPKYACKILECQKMSNAVRPAMVLNMYLSLLVCSFCWCTIIHSSVLHSFAFCDIGYNVSSLIYHCHLLFLLLSLAKGLHILFIFLTNVTPINSMKKQLLVFLCFSCLFSYYFI